MTQSARLSLALLAAALAGCSSSAGHPAATPGSTTELGSNAGVTFHGTIYVSGLVHNKRTSWHVTRTFTDRVPAVRTCADAANSGMAAGTFRVPSPQAPLPKANIELTSFRGPGMYPPRVMKHDKSDSIVLGHTSGMQRGTYLITTSLPGAAPGKEVLFLNKDGSGQLVYSEAHLDGKAGGPAVAGLISWSCSS